MDAAALFGTANVLYVSEEYEEALKHYTCAVTLQDSAEYRSCRAAAYLKLGKFAEALEDVAEALRLDPKCHMALHRKGVALFYVGEFAGAKAAFEESLRLSPGSKAPRALWLRKCDAELSSSTLPLAGIAAEIAKAPASACPPSTDKAASSAPAASALAAAPAAPAAAAASSSGRKPVKREWYQSATNVFVTLFAKGVAEDALNVEFGEKTLSVAFPLPGATDEDVYALDLDLFDDVDPSACKYEVSKVKVELCLAKKVPGVQWKDLERAEEVFVAPDQPAYPTSNKSKRDWGQVDKEMEEELKNDKAGGEDALNSLFKQIYERADDETRRAMNKSFQTSGGTVLSTNWGEVASSDYEGKDRPTPPEGQEWRDWKDKQ